MSTKTTTLRSPTSYFWLQLVALGAGLGALFLAHDLSRRLDESDVRATVGTAIVVLVVSVAVGLIGRAVHVIVTSAFSDAYRVFRSRHLSVCAALLVSVGAAEAGAVLRRGPFDAFFAHGRITGEVIVDVATVVTALVCLVGAGVALTGAWDRMHAERNWHRTLHLHSHRQH